MTIHLIDFETVFVDDNSMQIQTKVTTSENEVYFSFLYATQNSFVTVRKWVEYVWNQRVKESLEGDEFGLWKCQIWN